MTGRLRNWFDHRTGYRKLLELMLVERIPGGVKWRYVWGSALAIVFGVQLITGLLLVTAYSPGASTAWASVYFIQYQMDFGWLIRGIHHFGSQAMVVLLALHVLQVVWAGAHLPPREVNWWLGLGLMFCVLGLSLTGYLLPWDQKGYWATQVATNMLGNVPRVGAWLQRIVVGGPEYGHHTLARFYTLHVVLLPLVVLVLMTVHVALFRRHGVTPPRKATGEGWFWPEQAFRDLVIGLVVFLVMVGATIWGHGHAVESSGDGGVWETVARAGRSGLGANLDAPADPGQAYPARPEWYFLFLFQLLKYFEGDQEIVATVYIPVGATLAFILLPLLGPGRMRPFGRVVGVMVVVATLGGIGVLTGQAIAEDRADTEKARLFRRQRAEAEVAAKRAIQLADAGIPPAGPLELLERDPMTRGPELFGEHCASCHRYGDRYTNGDKASDLEGFGTEAWIRGLLKDPSDPKYFGRTELTRMAEWAAENLADLDEERGRKLDLVAAWLAGRPSASSPQAQTDAFKAGREAFETTFECTECHTYDGSSSLQRAPDLTDYGSAEWIRGMIMAADHKSRYGNDNTMPIFLELEGPDGAIVREQNAGREPGLSHLPALERELIIRWMTDDGRLVYGGDPITSPPAE